MRGSCAAESDTAGVFSLRALWRAYEVCRRRKRHTRNAQRFEIRLLDRLVETRDALANGSWHPSRTLCFITVRPKPREIHAADFGDRVVHHLLVPRLEALFEPVFIYDSYSNRPGKGTHAAVERLQQFLRQASRNGSRPAWFLQLDIRNFFHTIHRPTLYRLVLRRLAKAVRAGRIPALGLRVALPPRAVPGLLKRLERLGVGYRHVVEEGYLKTGFKRRVLRAVYCPDSPLLGQGGVARSAGVV